MASQSTGQIGGSSGEHRVPLWRVKDQERQRNFSDAIAHVIRISNFSSAHSALPRTLSPLFSLLAPPVAFMSSDKQASSQASSSRDATDYLRSATFSKSEGTTISPENAVTASDLLLGSYDPAKLHPLADIGDKLDYLLLDDDKTNELPGAGTAIPSRGWSDDLCYGTGTMYLSGMSFGSLSNYLFCLQFYYAQPL